MERYLVIACGLLMTATVCLGAPSSGTITIQGTIGPTSTITIAPTAGYNTLDIVNGVTLQKVADVTERSQVKTGYVVTMTSFNAGATGNSLFLVDTSGWVGADTVPYSLTYNGVPVAFSAGIATLTVANAKTKGQGVVKPLAVTITPSPVAAGTYADTLTLTITGK